MVYVGGENTVAIDLIVQHVHQQLTSRGHAVRSTLNHDFSGQPPPDSLHCLPHSRQIQGLHTFIRNRETPRDEFIFYSNRLMRLLFEYALSMLPFKVCLRNLPHFRFKNSIT